MCMLTLESNDCSKRLLLKHTEVCGVNTAKNTPQQTIQPKYRAE